MGYEQLLRRRDAKLFEFRDGMRERKTGRKGIAKKEIK
jgi:hypothetical protein